jgi:hypothetical protein
LSSCTYGPRAMTPKTPSNAPRKPRQRPENPVLEPDCPHTLTLSAALIRARSSDRPYVKSSWTCTGQHMQYRNPGSILCLSSCLKTPVSEKIARPPSTPLNKQLCAVHAMGGTCSRLSQGPTALSIYSLLAAAVSSACICR